ncbi:TPA: hypothetical protein L6B01_19045 [Pseudomonas aeruginosa]|nr:hypothetical protein [Pseudomonas aeruginosa]
MFTKGWTGLWYTQMVRMNTAVYMKLFCAILLAMVYIITPAMEGQLHLNSAAWRCMDLIQPHLLVLSVVWYAMLVALRLL